MRLWWEVGVVYEVGKGLRDRGCGEVVTEPVMREVGCSGTSCE